MKKGGIQEMGKGRKIAGHAEGTAASLLRLQSG